MGPRRDPDWMRTLDEVDEAVRGCLATLDKYEETFAHLLQSAGMPAERPDTADRVAEPDGASDRFTEHLAAAAAAADPIERLLAEQQAAWERWQRAFAAWRESLEQRLGPATPPTA